LSSLFFSLKSFLRFSKKIYLRKQLFKKFSPSY